MENILVIGVPNSVNLGDRIISETMNQILLKIDKGYKITNFDLTSGVLKNQLKASGITLNNNHLLKRLTPNIVRKLKNFNKYRKNNNLKQSLKEQIKKSDIIIIGGGHLLIDNYWNFPLGINQIIKEAKLQNKTVMFCFVGAKGPWSSLAKKHFLDALNYAKYIAVRDLDSKIFLNSMDKNLINKVEAHSDPAFFTDELYSKNIIKENKDVNKIGINIMDPEIIQRHSNLNWSRNTSMIWWTSLVKKLANRGFEIEIFTNGATTDNGFVELYIKKELENLKGIHFSNFPSSYMDLLNIINEQDVIIAQRLHACLPAISLGKCTFGLIWDKKITSIFSDINLENNIIDFNEKVEIVEEKIIRQIKVRKNMDENIIENIKKEMLNFVRKGVG